MGIDYSVHLAVGFVVTESDLVRTFGKQTVRRSHFEDRYDQRTGKLVGQVEVLDEPGSTVYVIDGKKYDLSLDAADGLASLVGAHATYNGCFVSDDVSFIIGPGFRTNDDDLDDGRFTVGGSSSFDEISKLGPELEAIRKKLSDLGLDPREAVVKPSWLIS